MQTEGERLRDEAVERVLDAIPEAWKEHAYWVIRSMAVSWPQFTPDDVHARLGDPPPGVSRNALGAVFARLSREGVIERTGEFTPSKRPGHHGHWYPVWRARR